MRRCLFTLLALAWLSVAAWADTLELVNGTKLEGQLVARDAESISFAAKVGERSYTRKYPLEKIAALTVNGKRETFGAAQPGPAADAAVERTPEQTQQLIAEVGRKAPEWWASVRLNYPQSLDLSWPDRPPPPWDNQRNVSQYIWDIINPNPARWQEGVRFVHYLLETHRDDPTLRNRAMRELARMYQDHLRDYPRAAYWWQKAGAAEHPEIGGVQLAECYKKLGCKELAYDLLGKSPPSFPAIKLWAELGEVDYALQIADANAQGPMADIAGVYAGDACRRAGRTRQALEYYQRVLAVPAVGRMARRVQRNQQRAAANIEGIKLFDTLDLARIPDGKYQGSSLGFEEPLQVAVTVRRGRIEAVEVTAQHEKQPYAALIETPARIVAKQSVKGIDTTSRATITSEAVINATAKALAGAMQ
jgi:uncharacterized protein with FMN-binding domain